MKSVALVFCTVIMMMTIHHASAGTTFTRWGRTTCPKSSIALYTGYVGAAHYTHTGSGSNYVCLHSNPRWGNGNVAGSQDSGTVIYGVEYELYGGYANNRPFSYENVGGRDLHNNDAVCVVCYNPEAHTTIMVPGIPDCPNAMKPEYTGYLVSSQRSQSRSEFVCLDAAPEARLGGEANQNGGLFYPVQAACGSLPCPPYVGGNEITCAVCTI